MSGIRGKNTKPEMMIRRALHARGFRYRIHCKDLPGNPDLCFPKYRAVVFVHGCFWHGHDCHLFKWPKTRAEFWHAKIGRNRHLDKSSIILLEKAGWRVATVWECALKGRTRLQPEGLTTTLAEWLQSDSPSLVIQGLNHAHDEST